MSQSGESTASASVKELNKEGSETTVPKTQVLWVTRQDGVAQLAIVMSVSSEDILFFRRTQDGAVHKHGYVRDDLEYSRVLARGLAIMKERRSLGDRSEHQK